MRLTRQDLITFAPPVAAMAVCSISLSISVPLFSLLMERIGTSGTVIGISHTISAAAMVVAAPVLPRILSAVGMLPLMLWSVVALTFCMLAIPVWENVWYWAVLRAVWGGAATALFFASEFWLISTVPDGIRGRIIGAYVVILSASYMLGPLLLNAIGIDSWLTYAVPTAVILVSSIPILLGRRFAPDGSRDEPPGTFALLKFFRTDPLIVWGVVLFGIVELGAMGLMTVWGLRIGYEQTMAVELVFWLAFGSLAFQMPVGWAADRFDRRKLLAIAGAVSVLMPLVIISDARSMTVVAAAVFVWGGMAVACYSIALTELGSRYTGAVLAEANAAVVLAYGLGALFSPTILGSSLDAFPPHGPLWMAAVAALAYFVLALVRIRTASRPAAQSALDSGPENSR